jgi:hypothetical protein
MSRRLAFSDGRFGKTCFPQSLYFYPEERGRKLLRNVGYFLLIDATSNLKKPESERNSDSCTSTHAGTVCIKRRWWGLQHVKLKVTV